MNSPKGKYRGWQAVIVGGVFLIIVALSGGFDMYGNWHAEKALSPNGWIFKQFNNLAEAALGIFALYAGHRLINHFRTHELSAAEGKISQLSVAWAIGWVIAIAIVVGHALD